MASDNFQLARQTKAVLATLALLGPLGPLPQDIGQVSSLLLGSSVVLCGAGGKALLSCPRKGWPRGGGILPNLRSGLRFKYSWFQVEAVFKVDLEE